MVVAVRAVASARFADQLATVAAAPAAIRAIIEAEVVIFAMLVILVWAVVIVTVIVTVWAHDALSIGLLTCARSLMRAAAATAAAAVGFSGSANCCDGAAPRAARTIEAAVRSHLPPQRVMTDPSSV